MAGQIQAPNFQTPFGYDPSSQLYIPLKVRPVSIDGVNQEEYGILSTFIENVITATVSGTITEANSAAILAKLGLTLTADNTNVLKVSLYGQQTVAGDTPIGVTSGNLIKAQANIQVGNTNVGNANPIPVNDVFGTQISASATGAAAASVTATLAAAAAKTTYMTMLILSAQAVAAVVGGVATIAGAIGGTLSIQFVETVASGALYIIPFPTPLQGSANNTALVINVPAITGGSAVSIAAYGYQN